MATLCDKSTTTVCWFKQLFLYESPGEVVDYGVSQWVGSTEESLNWLNSSPHRSRKPAHFNEHRSQGEPLYLFNLTEKFLQCLIRMRTECWLTFSCWLPKLSSSVFPYKYKGPLSGREVCALRVCVWQYVCACMHACVSLWINREHTCSPQRAQSQTWSLLEKITDEGIEYKGQEGNKAKTQTERRRKVERQETEFETKMKYYVTKWREKKFREAEVGQDRHGGQGELSGGGTGEEERKRWQETGENTHRRNVKKVEEKRKEVHGDFGKFSTKTSGFLIKAPALHLV